MTVKSGVIWTALGYGIWSACNMGMGLLIRLLAGKDSFGLYGSALKFSEPFIVFAALNMRTLIVTRVLDKFSIANCVATRIFAFLIVLPIIFLYAGFGGKDFSFGWLTFIFALGNAFDSVADTYFSIYQFKEKYNLLAISQILRGFLSIILFLVFYFSFHRSVIWGVGGSTLASLIMLVGWEFRIASELELGRGNGRIIPDFDIQKMKEIFISVFPLALSLFIESYTYAFPFFLVAQIVSPAHNSNLSLYGYVVNLGYLLVTGISMTLGPRFGNNWKTQNKEGFLQAFLLGNSVLFLTSLMIIVVVYFEGNFLVHELLRRADPVDAVLFTLIVVNGMLRYLISINGIAITSMQFVKGQVILNIPSLVVVLLMGYWLVKNFDLRGAVYALLIASTVKLVLATGVFIKRFGTDWATVSSQ